MPLCSSLFTPAALLSNGHLQTVLPVLLGRPFAPVGSRSRLELSDGDFLELDTYPCAREPAAKVAILSHGLEGCSTNGYIRGMAAALLARGWDVVAWNFRGCSGTPNRLLRFYHSGETRDLAAVIAHAKRTYSQIALVGFSLGGNITLKYLGEAPPDSAIVGGVAISTPADLAASARALDQRPGNRLYLSRFLKTMIAKIETKARLFPGQIDVRGARAICGFQEFDDRFTGPLHGFRDAAHYWKQCSARQYVPAITVPTLILSALNDPFLTPECFPFAEAENHRHVYLETPRSGGHVGFIERSPFTHTWAEKRAAAFLGEPVH